MPIIVGISKLRLRWLLFYLRIGGKTLREIAVIYYTTSFKMEQLRTRKPYVSINIVHNLWKGVAGKRNLTKLVGSLPIHQDRGKIQKLMHILERSTRVISHKVGAISWMVRWLFTFKSKFNLPGSGSAIQMVAANILSAHGGSKFNNPFWDIKPFGVPYFFCLYIKSLLLLL
jgi:hypothetical protein